MPQLNSPIYIEKEYSLLLGAMRKRSCKWLAVGTIKYESRSWWWFSFRFSFKCRKNLMEGWSMEPCNMTPTQSSSATHPRRKTAAILKAVPYRCWLLIRFSFSSALQRTRKRGKQTFRLRCWRDSHKNLDLNRFFRHRPYFDRVYSNQQTIRYIQR